MKLAACAVADTYCRVTDVNSFDPLPQGEFFYLVNKMTHTWYWRKHLPDRYGQQCRVLCTGAMNAALIEFEDGYRVVSSRYAVRKMK